MSELSARVLEEKFAVECKRSGKDVREQDSDVGKDVSRVRPPDNEFEGDEKPELTHESEANCKQQSNRHQKGVGEHKRILWGGDGCL